MNAQLQAQAKAQTKSGSAPAPTGLLQRKCACGNHTMAGGECEDCAKKNSGLQRKLTIGASNDPLEQEANRIAAQVMAVPAQATVSSPLRRIQRFSGEAAGRSDAVPDSIHQTLANPGKPLDPATRAFFEPRLGHDFSQVRVHSDATAEQSRRTM